MQANAPYAKGVAGTMELHAPIAGTQEAVLIAVMANAPCATGKVLSKPNRHDI